MPFSFVDYFLNRTNNINIVTQSNNIFYGIDNVDTYARSTFTKYKDFIKYKDIFPLKKMEFEDTTFLTPNNSIKILEDYFGKNWNSIPLDMGTNCHIDLINKFNTRK